MSLSKRAGLYIRMSRPNQLLSILLVYAWGMIIAVYHQDIVRIEAFIFGLLPLFLVSISIHYANEYADHETDALTIRTPFSGGSGALADYDVSPRLAYRAAWITLISGIFAALLLVLTEVLPGIALPILMLGAAGGWMYSLPPLALAWRGWGELDNAFLGGMLLPAYGYAIQTGTIDITVILISLPFGIHAFNNLLATTWADRLADRAVGKYTLATLWPRQKLRRLYFLLVFLAYVFLVISRDWLVPDSVFWLSLTVLPLAIWAGWVYTRQHSPSPSVMVMVFFLLVQMVTWGYLAFFTNI